METTQAQIEALIDNLRFLASKKDGNSNISRVASSTLIEAAHTIAALTAAAEVGEEVKFCAGCNCKTWHVNGVCEFADGHIIATIERCAQYHDKAADNCEKIAAVNMDNKLGADCLTRAQDHREDAAAIRAMKEN